MSVVVDTHAGFSFKPAEPLFDGPYLRGGQPPSYDVAPDGRFVRIKATNPRASVTPVTIVLNWAEKLRPLPR